MAQFFTMRFAYFYRDKGRGVFWSGPYQVPANNLTEAKDILTDVVLKEMRVETSPLFEIRLLEVENRMTPGRAEEHFASISVGIKDELWRRELRTQFPDGIPKKRLRSLDAQWSY